jgi:hypothetical protein
MTHKEKRNKSKLHSDTSRQKHLILKNIKPNRTTYQQNNAQIKTQLKRSNKSPLHTAKQKLTKQNNHR